MVAPVEMDLSELLTVFSIFKIDNSSLYVWVHLFGVGEHVAILLIGGGLVPRLTNHHVLIIDFSQL